MQESLRKKIIFTAFIIITTLSLLEAVLRISGYIILTSSQYSNTTSRIKGKNEPVILCLGDSFTFGLGTDYWHSYPRQLEGILNEKFPEKTFKIYNLGIPGSNSSQLLSNLQYYIDKYNPNLLIVMTGRNDIWNFTDVRYPSLSNNIDSGLECLRLYKLVKIFGTNLRERIEKIRKKSAITKAQLKFFSPRENLNTNQKRNAVPEADQLVMEGHDFALGGRDDLAQECFLRALQLDPQSAGANRQLGTIYRQQAKYELAEKCLTEALAQEGHCEDLSVYLELGMVHRLQSKYELARNELKQAMMDPRCISLAFNELWQAYQESDVFYRDVRKFREGITDSNIIDELDMLLRLRKNQEAALAITRRNLIKINELCKKNDVRLVFQTYPTLNTIAENIRKVAEKYRVPLADNYLIFQRDLVGRDKKEFFVADDHCNAQGYGIVAENICETLIKNRIIEDAINSTTKN